MGVDIRLKDLSTGNGFLSGVLTIGISASLGSILMSVSQVLVNSMMADYGDMAVVGIGVAMKVTMISSMLAIGLRQGTQPLIGYCVGAKSWDRFKEILKFSVVLAPGICLALTVVCYLFTGQLVEAFLTDPVFLQVCLPIISRQIYVFFMIPGGQLKINSTLKNLHT